jgi:hypothetical protein
MSKGGRHEPIAEFGAETCASRMETVDWYKQRFVA